MANEINVNQIKGIQIGNAQDEKAATGCTAIICSQGAVAGVDARGGGTATRETDLLRPEKMIEKIHCVMLSGGSAYGLAACDGAMEYLEKENIGFDVGVGVVPIVCGASLFDLTVGDSKVRPDKLMGYRACENSKLNSPKQGNFGAGTGASVGKFLGTETMMKSGLGIYAMQIGQIQCAAVVAVNAMGDIVDYKNNNIIAGLLSKDHKSFLNTEKVMLDEIDHKIEYFASHILEPMQNTTIGCIITNAKLTKAQANRLATITHNAYAKSIRPVHTSVDGDTIFVMSTGEFETQMDSLGILSTKVMSEAINNAVYNAKPAYNLISAMSMKN